VEGRILGGMTQGRISVIIPTLQEGPTIGGAVRSAWRAGVDEVIVSDAGSTDDTAANARRAGAIVIRGTRGRGPQLNAGAAVAAGDILWFIHADARVAPESGDAIRNALLGSEVVGGNFRIRFGASRHGRFLTAFYHVIRQFRVFYGDSAIFCRRSTFDAVGGFPPYPIMEDLKFVHALYRQGGMAYLQSPVSASPRRWEQGGVARTWAAWLVIQGLYFARVDPHRLAGLYRHIR
jgi:rSAM/selenodomain-associated transferase 2